ncbi:hypothetical protein [Sporichthya sp.]|uniref:arsenate reductase/protein-tyrosine-phosphatase family protein n=1 Tax=Sporichthya sp. TaxID=65475 RepID=UPI0017DF46AC|nr:hypothetical protein [Sporichthya sp.]MBA3744310.1 low molecular weight phosphatase family protein [Sporichthya sp.]
MASDDDLRGFRLLFVCTGNVCRSAFAELITAHLLAERVGSEVRRFQLGSAGTQAMVGEPIQPDARRELAPWKLDGAYADRFSARQLTAAMIEQADVVLTATPEHRAAALTLCPQALAKTFTLREFARLAAAVEPQELPATPVERAHALVARARSLRGKVRAASPADDAIVDPMGRSAKVHRQAATLITDATRTIVETIAL